MTCRNFHPTDSDTVHASLSGFLKERQDQKINWPTFTATMTCLPRNVYRSILRQIAWTSNTEIFSGITTATQGKPGHSISDDTCLEIINLRIEQLERVTIIIDGIDHCEMYEELLEIFCNLLETHKGKMTLLLTSRVHIPIQSPKYFPSCIEIDLASPKRPSDDMKFFIEQEMFGGPLNAPGGLNRPKMSAREKSRLLLEGKHENLELEVLKTLCSHAHGMCVFP